MMIKIMRIKTLIVVWLFDTNNIRELREESEK